MAVSGVCCKRERLGATSGQCIFTGAQRLRYLKSAITWNYVKVASVGIPPGRKMPSSSTGSPPIPSSAHTPTSYGGHSQDDPTLVRGERSPGTVCPQSCGAPVACLFAENTSDSRDSSTCKMNASFSRKMMNPAVFWRHTNGKKNKPIVLDDQVTLSGPRSIPVRAILRAWYPEFPSC